MKILIKIFVMVVSVALLAGCSHKQINIDTENTPSDTTENKQLSNNEVYNKIYNILSEGNVRFTLKDVDEEDIIEEYEYIVKEHPELFWLGDGYSYETITDDSTKTVTFECAHTSMQDISEKRSRFDSIVKKILDEANMQSTLYDKVIYIHDYIIDHTQYDQETYQKMNSSKEPNEIYEATTAFGCLVNNKAICSGYSAAFQLLMQKLDVTSGRVSGRKTGGEDHEWNYIVLDDEYYYVDVTWDDPINIDLQDNKTYEFFCITTDELKETHEIDKDQFVPECSANKYDYYIYNNLFLEQYDYELFKKIYKNNNDDRIEVKFSNSTEQKKAINDLILGQKIYDIAKGKQSCSYTTGNSERVLSITMK